MSLVYTFNDIFEFNILENENIIVENENEFLILKIGSNF